MPTHQRPFLALATGVALFGLVLPACGLSQDDESFRFDEEIERVDIDVDAGLIELRPSGGTGTSVDASREWGAAGVPDVDVWVEDGTLFVRGECSSSVACSTDFYISAPPSVEVDIEVAAGSVELRDMAGPIFADLTTGEIVGWDLAGDILHAEVVTGSIDLSFETGARTVYAEVVTGDLDLEVPNQRYKVQARATTGSVEIDVPTSSDADAFIAAQVVTGAVYVHTRD